MHHGRTKTATQPEEIADALNTHLSLALLRVMAPQWFAPESVRERETVAQRTKRRLAKMGVER